MVKVLCLKKWVQLSPTFRSSKCFVSNIKMDCENRMVVPIFLPRPTFTTGLLEARLVPSRAREVLAPPIVERKGIAIAYVTMALEEWPSGRRRRS